jgi:hypothetical protein
MAGTVDAITHREFKLLLKPEKFPKRSALVEFNKVLEENAHKLKVRYEPFDSLDSQLRIVQFYDTTNQSLRKRDLIFRVRQLRQGGWPDDSWEITFKCRAPQHEKAAGFDSNSAFPQQKKKFKEELLRGGGPGEIATIYSNNCIVEGPELDLEVPMEKLADAFPHMKTLDLDLSQKLSIVEGAKIFEIQAYLGNLFFGHHTTATATLALWARPIPDRFAAHRRVRLVVPSGGRRERERGRRSRRRVLQGPSTSTERLAPGGHLKIAHPWAVQNRTPRAQ